VSASVSTLGTFLRSLAFRFAEHAAVVGQERRLTFSALDAAADRWARALQRRGGPPVHVGLLAGNRPEWLAVAFGAWRAGGTLVPISTFVTARELSEVLEHADVDVLILQPQLRRHDLLAVLNRATLPKRLQQVVVLDSAPTSYTSAEEFLQRGSAASDDTPDPEAIACILYTSGTTGQPKGVQLSHRAILATVWPTAERSGLSSSDSLLSSLPLFWVAGLVIRALPTLATGCTLILPETFTPDAVVRLLQREHPTALHLRPPQVGQILGHPRFEPELLAHVHRGGGRVEWYAPWLDIERTRMITGYGMTEMAGYVTALSWSDPAVARQTQLGTLLPGVELRVVDDRGVLCPVGEVGEIRLRGPGLFSGYYRQPPGTGLDAEGLFCTGDLGRINAAGTFEFVGRDKDLLRIKGVNVSPLEVETVLTAHPEVEAVYVVGVPPDGLDQQLVALVVLRARAADDVEAGLRALAADALSHYKRPERYVFIKRGEVALSATEKPQRAALAQLAARRR
jgi:acyl-CoA synthetase (AMP-forming)/AMP-acid ligase II